MAIELFSNQVSVYRQEEFDSDPSLLSSVCQGIFLLMHGWYPITTDGSERHRGMVGRNILLTSLNFTATAHYRAFDYIPSLTERRETTTRNPNFEEAPGLIRRHERSLQREAGALTFYHRAIGGYLLALQKPLDQIDHRIAELMRTNPASEELPNAQKERSAAVIELKEQLRNFEIFNSASCIGLFEQIILQAVMIQTPLQTNGKPSDALPLGLHDFVKALERIQKIKDPAIKQQAIRAAASKLHQGSPLCVQPLSKIWQRYIKAPDFIHLRNKIFSL